MGFPLEETLDLFICSVEIPIVHTIDMDTVDFFGRIVSIFYVFLCFATEKCISIEAIYM